MIYKGPGILAVLWSGSCPTPSPLSGRKLDRRHIGRLRKRDNLPTEGGREERGGAESYDGENAWSSVNHSIIGKLDGRHIGRRRKRDHSLTEEGGRGGRGAQIIRRFFINHSILSDPFWRLILSDLGPQQLPVVHCRETCHLAADILAWWCADWSLHPPAKNII